LNKEIVMNKNDVIRAWKDPFYRASLPEEAQAALPQHPAGVADLTDDQIRTLGLAGGTTTAPNCTAYTYGHLNACCPATTSPLCTNFTYNGLAGCCPTTTA
jgi:mersacidin/lichenicidin family type 2 lantibiotic